METSSRYRGEQVAGRVRLSLRESLPHCVYGVCTWAPPRVLGSNLNLVLGHKNSREGKLKLLTVLPR